LKRQGGKGSPSRKQTDKECQHWSRQNRNSSQKAGECRRGGKGHDQSYLARERGGGNPKTVRWDLSGHQDRVQLLTCWASAKELRLQHIQANWHRRPLQGILVSGENNTLGGAAGIRGKGEVRLSSSRNQGKRRPRGSLPIVGA